MIIPWQELSEEALDNLIREYILAQVEEYQADNMNTRGWVEQVRQKLKDEVALIEWSEVNETVSIVDAKKYQFQNGIVE